MQTLSLLDRKIIFPLSSSVYCLRHSCNFKISTKIKTQYFPLTKGTWEERYLQVVYENGNQHSSHQF